MANNRMWLVHKPSGARALIAKHFGDGWLEYNGPRNYPYYSIQALFDNFGQAPDYVIEYEYSE